MTALADPVRSTPQLQFWNRTFLALVMSPAFPMTEWFAQLDGQVASAPGFFRDRPIVVDLAAVVRDAGPGAAAIVLDGFEARGLRIVAIEGVDPQLLVNSPWSGLAKALPGRDAASPPGAGEAEPTGQAAASLLIERPVRSGQSIVFEGGDVTIVGAVASGAEVIAGGSIHIYGALRGRAIAGLRPGAEARIFCRRLEAEMVGIERLYRTAEHWGPALHGRAVQVRVDRGGLRLTPLD